MSAPYPHPDTAAQFPHLRWYGRAPRHDPEATVDLGQDCLTLAVYDQLDSGGSP